MAFSAIIGKDHTEYLNPYDNAVITYYISRDKNNFSIEDVSGGNPNGILLIDLEALCAPQGPFEYSLPDTLVRFPDKYRDLILKNMGHISENKWDYKMWEVGNPRSLYFSGRTYIPNFSNARKYFKNIYADHAALTYSGYTASNFYGSIASPPSSPGRYINESTWIKVDGNYLQAKNYINIAQEWRPVRNVYEKVNGVWKRVSSLKTYYFCNVYAAYSSGWVGDRGSAYKRGGFCSYMWSDCDADQTYCFKKNEIFMAIFKFPPLEGFNSKECYICNGAELPQYELIDAYRINTGTYKIQFTGSVFKVIS
ncbi:MAG: hypothetical protein HFI75_03640 [Lachnospiraceae bacterium]|nr:hypothetical protein [Lachnospiraceae bacterium]